MCLTCFKCMLLIKHKMMLFRKVVSARPVGWMTASMGRYSLVSERYSMKECYSLVSEPRFRR
jgi:hypothetical protein